MDIQSDAPTTPLSTVRDNIARSEKIAGRPAGSTTLIAISKTKPVEAIEALIGEGQMVFGENRVQEAALKFPPLRERYPDLQLHMVGQLQSNKADEAVALFDCIHSLDRPSLARALAGAMDKAGRRVPCFVQVNIGEEEQKGGCAIAELPRFLADVKALGLPVVGLMAVPPADLEPAPYFALLAKLAREHGLDQLSMGMSGDYETAVRIGATHVRVGSALFGAR
ncbi:MAG: YggS family pyridoxal phosphate enzyme [Sphingomonadales bacterium RIFCSPHIGHO2_01_FULL_65_20]|jgi:pyridoxal phosphate enzyme (YggS family)|uniref:YggS family pyridoxal phosphate-dependent enzyme n=1 Tax=unclassified Blastomonas TaxID=2626550 RepID=UPI0008316463|nr:YggS family pyridoxal phosphate-dependent enzyme [Blastomonas sp.]MCH2239977.1 YggS family pyridoxal phosphate-dependent enzyme [Blastomonas sp.]OHC97854.1 MAG: YggS family pyridoxal phosphate enzyme [Sphingomonadales bacterium RIFCSPHIGHO2_01_FULL_65_20]